MKITKKWMRDAERKLRNSTNASERVILALIRRIRRVERAERKLQLDVWALSALVKTLDSEKGKP